MRESSSEECLSLGVAGRADGARYAGWIGTVAAASKDSAGKVGNKPGLREGVHRLAAIAGTSTCHIAQSDEGILVPGVVSLSR
jgi:ribulose kinase